MQTFLLVDGGQGAAAYDDGTKQECSNEQLEDVNCSWEVAGGDLGLHADETFYPSPRLENHRITE